MDDFTGEARRVPTVVEVINYAIRFGTVIVFADDFFDIADGRFFIGDCLEVMKRIPDASIDMILCDLPYGTTQNKWDSVIPFDALWKEYERVIAPHGCVVLTAMQPFTSALTMSNVKWFKQALVWKKNVASNFLNANRYHLLRHEDILVFSKNQPIFNKQMLDGKAYTNKRTGKDDTGNNYGSIKQRNDTVNDGKRNPISVLEFDRESKPFHPTQKPVPLFEYLIKTYTNEGMTVLDSCAGSGTTALAAINCGRSWVCIEKDEKYAEAAIARINAHAERGSNALEEIGQ